MLSDGHNSHKLTHLTYGDPLEFGLIGIAKLPNDLSSVVHSQLVEFLFVKKVIET